MRVLFCKIHCPSFICFCKPSSHIYTTGPLKLENTPDVPNSNSTTTTTTTTTTTNSSVVSVIDEAIDNKNKAEEESVVNGKILQNRNQKQEKLEEEEEEEQQEEEEIGENSVKSSIKKPVLGSKEVEKKRVQWMDFMGKELVEVREFEASEIEDTDNDSEYHRGCVCTIL